MNSLGALVFAGFCFWVEGAVEGEQPTGIEGQLGNWVHKQKRGWNSLCWSRFLFTELTRGKGPKKEKEEENGRIVKRWRVAMVLFGPS